MFKKPLSGLKTSAPLRSSDRRKLKQRVITGFSVSSDDGDLLVPEGILSVKFSTHLDEPGVAYLSPDGDPLWFTIGKGSDDLIPTVYTLWKRNSILPFLSTPSAVIPVLVGGADLMIPGVIHHPPSLGENELVSISQYYRHNGQPTLSPPLAVGRMALPSDKLKDGGTEKGKAVHIIHTWKDHLWDLGSKPEVPEGVSLQFGSGKEEVQGGEESTPSDATPPPSGPELTSTPAGDPAEAAPSYTPQEITDLLHMSLLQAISSSLATLPPSSFPIPSTAFYTNYILTSRPAFPSSVRPPSASTSSVSTPGDHSDALDPQDITIKASTHKSLTTFLKSAEKASLLTTKAPQKHSQQTELLVTAVNASHPSVVGHKSFVTVKDIEARAAKKARGEEKEREALTGSGELQVTELWKPHQTSVGLFTGLGGNTTSLYNLSEIKALINSYIASKSLVNATEQAYINLDDLLYSCVSSKSKGKSKGKDTDADPPVSELLKRDELMRRIVDKMQSWYEIKAEGKDAVCKKGALAPIQVATKIRQGRKASTLITRFEPFLVIDAEEMAEELRKACAGATSVSPIPGKPAGSGLEVLVQGKQSKAVVDYLIARGIPKKWIGVVDIAGKK